MQITEQTAPDFSDITPERPEYESLVAEYDALMKAFSDAPDAEARTTAVETWDHLRRQIDSWASMVHLNFAQDTQNEEYKAAREYCDELGPKITDLDVKMKRALLGSPHRKELESRFGGHAFLLWEADVAAFDPKIQPQLVKVAKLDQEYTELMSSARFEIDGKTVNLSGIRKYTTDKDRDVRHGAMKQLWGYFAKNGEQFDRIYDDMVTLRHGMARELGYDNYIGLGYKNMKRIDYDQQDVERYRQQVVEHVVPLATELFEQQRERLGIDQLMAWDEGVYDTQGNPKPGGDEAWMLERAQEMFDALGPDLSSFFRMMNEKHLLDLDTRDTKAPGGFCTGFPSIGVPYIFANFNGTKGDVEVFTHEAGHAFQGWRSRGQQLSDYLWPTMESCEIHSMSLEFLTWPHMDKFFGDDAERFRQIHLSQSLTFLPYGVAVDHFQHLVYEKPDASPAERHAMWKQMEELYLPHRNWGDLEYPANGGRWQAQLHIYGAPFYYIDYTLAQACALQFWVRSRENFDEAMTAYVALCERGGEAPFQELAKSAGLNSPFAEGALVDVVGHARKALGV